MAEDRERFQELVERLGLNQPANGTALRPAAGASTSPAASAYPVLVRPSFVLGGRGMEIVYDEAALSRYVEQAIEVYAGQAGADRQVPGVGRRGGRRLPQRRRSAR